MKEKEKREPNVLNREVVRVGSTQEIFCCLSVDAGKAHRKRFWMIHSQIKSTCKEVSVGFVG